MNNELKEFPQLTITKKSGQERFSQSDKTLNLDLFSFWQWSGSDLNSNTARGVLAEFIVANALGIADKLRIEWDAFDLLTNDGLKIEVKSSSYLQTWHQRRLSTITFGIQPTRLWDALTNSMVGELQRQADIYVFCVLAHREPETLDPLSLDQWEFYILATSVLNEKCSTQKTIGLARLLTLGPMAVKHDGIADAVVNLQL